MKSFFPPHPMLGKGLNAIKINGGQKIIAIPYSIWPFPSTVLKKDCDCAPSCNIITFGIKNDSIFPKIREPCTQMGWKNRGQGQSQSPKPDWAALWISLQNPYVGC